MAVKSRSKHVCGMHRYVRSAVAGVDYVFTVTASKGSNDGAEAWAHLRSDNASCVVSTSALALPQVSINPKVIQ